jgi:hypothetical protein
MNDGFAVEKQFLRPDLGGRCVIGLFVLICVTGCAGGHARAGGGLPNVDVETLRKVQTVIVVSESVPEDAVGVQEIHAARGHRDTRDIEPTNNDVLLDLKCGAYALGCDGIASVKYERKSGLLNNYWYVIEGVGIGWKRKPAEH